MLLVMYNQGVLTELLSFHNRPNLIIVLRYSSNGPIIVAKIVESIWFATVTPKDTQLWPKLQVFHALLPQGKYSDSQKHESSCLLRDRFCCISPEPLELQKIYFVLFISSQKTADQFVLKQMEDPVDQVVPELYTKNNRLINSQIHVFASHCILS